MEKKQNKTIIRNVKNKNNPYVMINKSVFEDENLSWKAKGLMGYFLSKPDNWSIMIVDLIKRSKDGRDSVYSGIAELKKYGYLQEVAYRKRGKIVEREYQVYESPELNPYPKEKWGTVIHEKLPDNLDTENPDKGFELDTDFPDQEKHNQENPTLIINEYSNNEFSNKEDDDAPAGSTKEEWKDDIDFLAFRKRFTDVGADDIILKERIQEAYKVFKAIKAKIGFSTLISAVEKHIEEEGANARILWFLGGGYKRYFPKKKTNKKPAARSAAVIQDGYYSQMPGLFWQEKKEDKQQNEAGQMDPVKAQLIELKKKYLRILPDLEHAKEFGLTEEVARLSSEKESILKQIDELEKKKAVAAQC